MDTGERFLHGAQRSDDENALALVSVLWVILPRGVRLARLLISGVEFPIDLPAGECATPPGLSVARPIQYEAR